MELAKVPTVTQEVVELYSEGLQPKDIAMRIGVPTREIIKLLSQPEVKKMVDDTITAIGNAIVAKNMMVVDEIIKAKLKIIEDGDVDLSFATKKDIIDLMKITSDIVLAKEKLTKDDTGNTYISILNGILNDK